MYGLNFSVYVASNTKVGLMSSTMNTKQAVALLAINDTHKCLRKVVTTIWA